MGVDTIKVPRIGYGLSGIFKIHPNKRDRVATAMAEWMDAENVSKDAVAINLGVNHESVTNYRWGRSCPGLVQAFLIERMSKGKVPVASWLGIPPAVALFQQLEMKRKSRQAGNYSTKHQRAGRVRR